ncbi:MAG TPA: beta-L-arabinofuranosidase domain-containing protein [Lachnospiraceae bacterium]|nr:beta-L-arabinofuranosidase domain-containing protein [Lachnospiraceae bacterium]
MSTKLITPTKFKEVPYGKVTIKDPYLMKSFEKEIAYLEALEPDRLVAGFLDRAGLPMKAERYPGWEVTEIQGHTLGHYLTALSQAYSSTLDSSMLQKLEYTISELARSQSENGYLFAWNEEIFDRVENRKPAWVPWYTMHKILAGLISVCKHTGIKQALHVTERLGDWIADRANKWSKETQATVLSVEYGGMNDGLYELYKLVPKQSFLQAAHQFDELPLFDALHENKDVLNGRHANTTIPKILGGLNRYLVLGDSENYYLEMAMNFFDIVNEYHSYVTGGNSEWEHFGAPGILDAERTNCNCETCNTYNMLKLASRLFQITGNRKYADFYENTFINAIMSSQNPDTGMTMYFQPMATGYFKVYSTPFDKFWCCTGTGMENFTKLNESIYYSNEETLVINRYVSSDISFEAKGVTCQVAADLPYSDEVTIRFATGSANDVRFTLLLRKPNWISETPTVLLNGEVFDAETKNEYLLIDRNWTTGDTISLTLPMVVRYASLPDNDHSVAFTYGPVVLSAGLGCDSMTVTATGVDVTVPNKDSFMKDYIVLTEGSISDWLGNLRTNLVKRDGEFGFVLKGTDSDSNLVFTPHYKQHSERYGIYWQLYEKGDHNLEKRLEMEAKRAELDAAIVDTIPVGNDQYELAHRIRGHQTDSAIIDGNSCRITRESGWFSYHMQVKESPQYLVATYSGKDEDAEFDILIDDTLFVTERVENGSGSLFYQKTYRLPDAMIQGKEQITVRFAAKKKDCRLFDELYIRNALDSDK